MLLKNEEIDEEAVAIFSQMLLAKNVSQSLVFSKPIN
jgi:hypothetical protein